MLRSLAKRGAELGVRRGYCGQKKNDKGFLESARRSVLDWKDGRQDLDLDYPWVESDCSRAEAPRHTDVVVIGGGAIGSSIAFWLKQRIYDSLNVVVVEKDPTYSKASTSLSVGGLRQQFSLPENVEMSLFGAEFLRDIDSHLNVSYDSKVDVQFHPYGYLTLASASSASTLAELSELQNRLGAKNVLLTSNRLRHLFPWLSTEGVELGCLGLEREGWFDPWSLLCGLRTKAKYLGADFVDGEVIGFGTKRLPDAPVGLDSEECEKLSKVIIRRPDGAIEETEFAIAVIAAGAWSGSVGRLAGVGVGEGVYAVGLPVEPRKRYVYCVESPGGPGLNTPLTIDTSGTYFRRDGLGGRYICGRSPSSSSLEPPTDSLSVDDGYFEEHVWPMLAKRVPAFQTLKLRSSWAGYYEYNSLDRNGIIGQHPRRRNLLIATGFSGHGIQQAPAVGRAISELIIDSGFMTIDLQRLGFERIVENKPLPETNIF